MFACQDHAPTVLISVPNVSEGRDQTTLDQYTGWNAWAMVSSLVWSRPSDTLGTEISTVGA